MDLVSDIESGVSEMGLAPLSSKRLRAMATYVELLDRWNRTYNLTAVRERREMVPKHILDSLAGLPFVRGNSVLDVGSGAGLPGIPLAIASPDKSVTLLDVRRKRIRFLRHVKQVLCLNNVRVLEGEFPREPLPGPFTTLTARAYAPLEDLVPQLLTHCRLESRALLWQAADPSPQLASIQTQSSFDYRVNRVYVPGLGATRHILVIWNATGCSA